MALHLCWNIPPSMRIVRLCHGRKARKTGKRRLRLAPESEPNVTDLRSVCEETRTSVEWLVTGRGEREARALGVREAASAYENTTHKPLDYALLEAVIAAVDEELRRSSLALPSTKRSMLIVTLYDISHERKQVDREGVARLVKLAG